LDEKMRGKKEQNEHFRKFNEKTLTDGSVDKIK
jgi:hypothetical protein